LPKAIKYLERAVDLSKGDPLILEHLGDAYHSAGMIEKSISAYKESLSLKKNKNIEIKLGEMLQ